jgi:hypothetical protein
MLSTHTPVYAHQSPYAYAANNPSTLIDFMGLGPTGADGMTNEQWMSASNPANNGSQAASSAYRGLETASANYEKSKAASEQRAATGQNRAITSNDIDNFSGDDQRVADFTTFIVVNEGVNSYFDKQVLEDALYAIKTGDETTKKNVVITVGYGELVNTPIEGLSKAKLDQTIKNAEIAWSNAAKIVSKSDNSMIKNDFQKWYNQGTYRKIGGKEYIVSPLLNKNSVNNGVRFYNTVISRLKSMGVTPAAVGFDIRNKGTVNVIKPKA